MEQRMLILLLLLPYSICLEEDQLICAVANFDGSINGTVKFQQHSKCPTVRIEIDLQGIPPGLHGFHAHQFGDVRNGCLAAGPHFNPDSNNHGGPDHSVRHAGDFGNIQVGQNGMVKANMLDGWISLHGPRSIIGRALVVHEDKDDLGLGGNAESLKTGNAGKRIACAVIGYANC